MFKNIALITRKPGLSRDEFIAYYEASHAPLAKRLFPQFVQYRRNFIEADGAILSPGMSMPSFDSVTEIWFESRAAREEMLSTHFTPEIQNAIESDERNFLDQSVTLMFNVDERGAQHSFAELGADKGLCKVIALLTMKPGITRQEFIDYYETRHSRLIWSKFPWILEYRRNFIDLEGSIIAPQAKALDFDVITELWFNSRADYDRMLDAHAIPEVGQAIAEDEANCFDRSKTRFFVVEERVSP
jgi:uncharacterized protein (TIGR02118 family)